MNKEKAIFCWSGGKDSALCLHKVLEEGNYEVICLLTTVNSDFQRVSMHGVRETLLNMQALAIGIPVEKVYVGLECSNVEYEREMEKVLLKYKAKGVQKVIFGDIFLEDLRVYRENNLSKIGMKGVFPLWKQDTKLLINEFISSGFEAIICCTDNKFFTSNIVGRFLDNDFIKNLPSDVDPCGENGEFHTFTFNGPIFKEKITFNIGEKLYKQISNDYDAKGFWYCDLY